MSQYWNVCPQASQVPVAVGLTRGCLTVKLRGRPEAPDWSRGCILSSRTRGDTADSHGPLQRLLDDITARVAIGFHCCRKYPSHRTQPQKVGRERSIPLGTP